MLRSEILATAAASSPIPIALVIPFAVLLLLIAVMPLTPKAGRHFWEHYHPHVSIAFGLLMAFFYLAKIDDGAAIIGHTLAEYFSFIVLIGALFVVAGGIHIRFRGESTPLQNGFFLLAGSVLANVLGTTGASILLIRPWIHMNKYRFSGFHLAFFIFTVSNVGGCLTPIGDPPLFLGFLRGVPFFWLIKTATLPWLTTVGLVIAAFLVYDYWSFHRVPKPIQEEAEEPGSWKFQGKRNLYFLAAVIGGVFLPAAYFIREFVMIAAAAVSYFCTPKEVHHSNAFSFAPIKEVAFLFIGIFLTMMPALGYLEHHGREFGFERPREYYFATGALSATLDNAPTYVNFLKLAEVSAAEDETPVPPPAEGVSYDQARIDHMLDSRGDLVLAVSLGAVFFGAMTYIGNGPNFMVKSIAEAAGVSAPSFFGYILRFSLPILLPILALVGFIFV